MGRDPHIDESGTSTLLASDLIQVGDAPTKALIDRPSTAGWLVAVGAFLLVCLQLPELSTSVWPPKAAVLLIMGAAGVPLLIARMLGKGRSDRGASEIWAARAAVAFIAAATVSTIGAVSPVLATVGLYAQGTGLIFIVALAGCWAVGTGLRRADRDLLIQALIVGAVANGVVAILQQIVGLSKIGIFPYQGLPTGLQGNPVYMGELLAASLALLGERFIEDARKWWLATVVVSLGIGVGTERLPAMFAVIVVIVELLLVFGRKRVFKSSPPATGTAGESVKAAGGFAVLVVGGVLAGSIISRLENGVGVVAHVAASTTAETFGQRFTIWKAALHAVAHRPLFGSGPGQFRAATSSYFTVASQRNLDSTITDAHNFVVEYATTTGLIGVALLIAWIILALYGRRGRLLWFSGIILLSTLAEPLNVATTPLAFLALGATAYEDCNIRKIFRGNKHWTLALLQHLSGRNARTDKPIQPEPAPRTSILLRTAMVVMVVVALLPATVLLVGDAAFGRADSEYQVAKDSAAIQSATTANKLLSPWPDPASELAQIYNYQALGGVRGASATEIHWGQIAVSRDPTNYDLITSLAISEFQNHDTATAIAAAKRALGYANWYTPAMNILGYMYLVTGKTSEGRMWLERSLQVEPGQRSVEMELQGKCLPHKGSALVKGGIKASISCI